MLHTMEGEIQNGSDKKRPESTGISKSPPASANLCSAKHHLNARWLTLQYCGPDFYRPRRGIPWKCSHQCLLSAYDGFPCDRTADRSRKRVPVLLKPWRRRRRNSLPCRRKRGLHDGSRRHRLCRPHPAFSPSDAECLRRDSGEFFLCRLLLPDYRTWHAFPDCHNRHEQSHPRGRKPKILYGLYIDRRNFKYDPGSPVHLCL